MTKLYPYQQRVYRDVLTLLEKERVVCVAATTGFGKTELICKLIADNPGVRFLILAHGQHVLRQNFTDRLMGKPELRDRVFELTDTRKILKISRKQNVIVALPHSIHRHLSKLDPFDYLIVDEAHEFYVSDPKVRGSRVMYDKILSWHEGSEILLTASHYILKDFPKVFYSREEALARGQIADVHISIQSSSFRLKSMKLYTDSGDLKTSVDVKASIREIVPHLVPKNYPIIVARHSQKAADQLYEYLRKQKSFKGRVTVSHASNDEDSVNIDGFKRGRYDVLIVVQRAALGFDYPALATYLDATFSRSLTRIEQMMGRVARIAPKPRLKQFIKLSAVGLEMQTELVLAGALALGEKNLYQSWNELEKDLPLKRAALKSMSKSERDPLDPKEDGEASAPPIAKYLMSFSEYFKISSLEKLTFSSAMDYVKSIGSVRRERQSAIRKWAQSGKPKPPKKDPAYSMFHQYLTPSQNSYDERFREEIEKLRPDWFMARPDVEGNKRKLMALAKAGKKKPSHSEKLGDRFHAYTNPKLTEYDAIFEKAMRKLVPDWFITPSERVVMLKQKLLKMAKAGRKPLQPDHPDYVRYRMYLAPSSNTYDPAFVAELKKTAPQWFPKSLNR